MVPFNLRKKVYIKQIAEKGFYKVEDIIAKAEDEDKNLYEFTMLQRWPVKMSPQPPTF